MPATDLRRFVPPSRPLPLSEFAGPPPIIYGPEAAASEGYSPDVGGPPPLTLQQAMDIAVPRQMPLDQRQNLAAMSPTQDANYEPFLPTEQELQVRPNLPMGRQKIPGQPGGLRKALSVILPAARDLAAGAAAGASQPTFVQGLGAGLQQMEHDESRRMQNVLAWHKMQQDAAKTQAEIEKAGAETSKAREETRLMAPKQQSLAELQQAQAAQARDTAAWSASRAKYQDQLTKAGMPAAEAKEKAARAANYEMENKWIQEGLDSGLRREQAKLYAAERRRQVAEATKAEQESEYVGENVRIHGLMADAQYQNSVAALNRAAALAQQGQIRPADISRAEGAYDTARSRILAARANALFPEDKKLFDQELQKLEERHNQLMQGMRTPRGGPPSTSPGGGAPNDPAGIR